MLVPKNQVYFSLISEDRKHEMCLRNTLSTFQNCYCDTINTINQLITHFSVKKIFCIFRVSNLHKNLCPSIFSITTENFDEIEEKRRKSSSAKDDVNIRFSVY